MLNFDLIKRRWPILNFAPFAKFRVGVETGGPPPKVGGPLKPPFGLSGEQHFWQKRYYDFNIRDYPQFVEELRYIHRNPVKAGLCERPEDWGWSSFRHYATGREGRVEIESEWTARKRERAAGRLCAVSNYPLKPKAGLNGPPVKLTS